MPRRKETPDQAKPSLSLLIKLGSIAVHADEMLSPQGHSADKIAIQSLLSDPELQDWIAQFTAQGFLPVKR